MGDKGTGKHTEKLEEKKHTHTHKPAFVSRLFGVNIINQKHFRKTFV